MKTIEYRTRTDKLEQWGAGPWVDEPDKKQWPDASTDMPCLIVRSRRGALCGYVGVPPGHPAHGAHYDSVDPHPDNVELTFSESCDPKGESEPEHHICHIVEPGEPDDVWWLGFDCAHYDDYVPGMDVGCDDRSSYKEIAYVEEQCAALAHHMKHRFRVGIIAMIRRIFTRGSGS